MSCKYINHKLTGKIRHRQGIFSSKLILQVQEQYELSSYGYCPGLGIEEPIPSNGNIETWWRDATIEDIQQINITCSDKIM